MSESNCSCPDCVRDPLLEQIKTLTAEVEQFMDRSAKYETESDKSKSYAEMLEKELESVKKERDGLDSHIEEIYECLDYTKQRSEQTGESAMDIINDFKRDSLKVYKYQNREIKTQELVRELRDGYECWLIWSNEHMGWWGCNSRGYVESINKAGRYKFDEAVEICKSGTMKCSRFGGVIPKEIMVPDLPVIKNSITKADKFLGDSK